MYSKGSLGRRIFSSRREKVKLFKKENIQFVTCYVVSCLIFSLPGLPGLDARLDNRGEVTGVSVVSTLTSLTVPDWSTFVRSLLASFSRLTLVI